MGEVPGAAGGQPVPEQRDPAGQGRTLRHERTDRAVSAPHLRVAGGPRPAPYRASVQWERRYARLLAAFDAVAITVAAVLAFFVRFGERTPASPPYLLITVLLPGVWVASMALGRAYEPRFLGAGSEEFRRVVNAAACVIAGVAVVSYATKAQIARGYVLLALPLATVLAVAGRSVGGPSCTGCAARDAASIGSSSSAAPPRPPTWWSWPAGTRPSAGGSSACA